MQDFLEKRGFPRMITDCSARYSASDASPSTEGMVKNLSGSGMMLWTKEPQSVDDELRVRITPLNPVTPPLEAIVKVSRCEQVDDEDVSYQFALACAVERFEDVAPEQD